MSSWIQPLMFVVAACLPLAPLVRIHALCKQEKPTARHITWCARIWFTCMAVLMGVVAVFIFMQFGLAKQPEHASFTTFASVAFAMHSVQFCVRWDFVCCKAKSDA